MQGDSASQRGQIRGFLFEYAILKMLKNNGFNVVGIPDTHDRIREIRSNFIELKGRGAWHQIDCPCDYNIISPFMYPIRMLGEVKCYKNPIGKDKIRNFIGVIKDIQENYFADELVLDVTELPKRFIEVGAFFSSSGFDKNAEFLAYAHGIKTISYQNNLLVAGICDAVYLLEKNISYENFTNKGTKAYCDIIDKVYNRNGFIDLETLLKKTYEKMLDAYFSNEVDIKTDQINSYYINNLIKFLNSILTVRSSFIATNDQGLVIHFVGNGPFPDEIFENSDEAFCNVYYRGTNKKSYWLEFKKYNYQEYKREGKENTKFYFSPPRLLLEAIENSEENIRNVKQKIFHKMIVHKIINQKQRTVIINLDPKQFLDKRQ